MDPRGKTALVTGASGGIGAATARALAAAGARVLLAARRAEELERVAASIGSAVAGVHPVDLSNASARKLVVTPFMMKLTYWQHAVFPGVVQWLMTRTGYTRPRA